MPIPELLAGWQRFVTGRFRDQQLLFERLHRDGQHPRVAMVACCDSRVDPSMVFDCDPGDLFVVRNVGNLVPPCEHAGAYHGTSAALEFAVAVLGVSHIVVLGHALCGGIRALFAGLPEGQDLPFLSSWIELASVARAQALQAPGLDLDQRAALGERYAVAQSVHNLGTFPLMQRRMAAGTLRLHGWHFDFRNGALEVLDPLAGRFRLATAGGSPGAS